MNLARYKEGIKKRRQERLRLLHQKKRLSSSSPYVTTSTARSQPVLFSDRTSPKEGIERPQAIGFSLVLQVTVSILLFASVYVIMQIEDYRWADAQSFIQEVMEKEYNVEGLWGMYEKYLDREPTFLPAFFRKETPPDHPNDGYSVPVAGGQVKSLFGQVNEGIRILTQPNAPVSVIKEGWVTFLGEKEGLGFTIVIDHGDREESWYSSIEGVQVNLNDWVSQGQVLGHAQAIDESGQGVFELAIRKELQFIDPMEVISFD